MSGNRKHGFMRGNAAGRNGSGTPKGFLCDACEKQHGDCVERVGLNHLLGSDIVICDRKYFAMKDDEFASGQNRAKAIAKLKRLKIKTHVAGEQGLKHRIDFACTVFKFDLRGALTRYELFDNHNLGERDFDTCFEMHDGDLVVHGIIKQAKKQYWLKLALKRDLNEACYQDWEKIFARVENEKKTPMEVPTQTLQLSIGL